MTYSIKERFFASESELLSFLRRLPFASGEQVGIIAGHFMLMYDDQDDCLVPMVHQDASNPEVKALSKEMAGDFPLKTFKLGVDLFKVYESKQVIPKLALIVNDHIFQTKGWTRQNLKDKGRTGELRHGFYRQKHPLPKSFFSELKLASLTTDVLLENNNSARTPTDIQPKMTRLFSEQALRNYFDQNTRLGLRKFPMFKEVQQNGTKSKLMFVGDSGDQSVCLTEGGDCGCSGELIEFFVRLARKELKSLVFFVPDECKYAANAGVKAFLHTPKKLRNSLSSIYVVAGLGGMGIDPAKARSIEVTIHRIPSES